MHIVSRKNRIEIMILLSKTSEEWDQELIKMNELIQSMAADRIDENTEYRLHQPFDNKSLDQRASLLKIINRRRKKKW